MPVSRGFLGHCRAFVRRFTFGTLVGIACLSSVACEQLTPKSEIESWRITALDAQKVDTDCNIKIVSQWFTPLPIVEIKGTVSCENKELATLHLDPGTATELPAGGTIHAVAHASATYANMASILSTTTYGPGSEIPITITAKVTVRLGNNNWDFPDLKIDGIIPILIPPTGYLDGAPTFSRRTKDDCRGQVKIKVNNPNKFALTLRELSGDLQLKELGSSNPAVYKRLAALSLSAPVTIAAQQSSTIPIDFQFVPSTLFNGPQIPPTPTGNIFNAVAWANWAATVIQNTLSSASLNPPPVSANPNDWTNWASGLVNGWWTKLLDAMTPADNYKASFSTKFRTPRAPFDIPFSLGN